MWGGPGLELIICTHRSEANNQTRDLLNAQALHLDTIQVRQSNGMEKFSPN